MATFENTRLIKIIKSFDGSTENGANGNIDLGSGYYTLDSDEFIYEVFYKVPVTLTSGDTAGTYIKMGIKIDDEDAILTSSTGIVDTLNAGAAGTKPTHAYSIATVDGREIYAEVVGTNDITGGTIWIYLTIARGNETDIVEGLEY